VLQRLAHRGLTDPELLGELLLAQPLTGLDGAGENQLPDVLDEPFTALFGGGGLGGIGDVGMTPRIIYNALCIASVGLGRLLAEPLTRILKRS